MGNQQAEPLFDDHGMPKGRIITTTSNFEVVIPSRRVSKTRSLMPGSNTVNETSNLSPVPDYVAALDRICRAYGRHLRQINNISPVQIEPNNHKYQHGHGKYRIIQDGTTITLVMEVVSIPSFKNTKLLETKTIGFARPKNQLPTSMAVSGWTAPCKQRHEFLLDNEFWTDAVRMFSDDTGFRLPSNCWDGKGVDGKRQYGRANACHVEKKLMLQSVCQILYDKNLGGLSREKLKAAREAKLEWEIVLDLAPCKPCKGFGRLLREITGIHFSIHTQNVLQRLMPMVNRQSKSRGGQMNTESIIDETYETYEGHRPDDQINYQHSDIANSCGKAERKKNKALPRGRFDVTRKCPLSNLRSSPQTPSSRSLRITKLQQQRQAKVRRSSFKMESFSRRRSVAPFEAKVSGLQRGARAEKSCWQIFAEEEFAKFTTSASKNAASNPKRMKPAEEPLEFTGGRPEATANKDLDLQSFVELEFLRYASNLKVNSSKAPPHLMPAPTPPRSRPAPRPVTPPVNSSSFITPKVSPEIVVAINKFRYTPSPTSKTKTPKSKLFNSPPVPFRIFRNV